MIFMVACLVICGCGMPGDLWLRKVCCSDGINLYQRGDSQRNDSCCGEMQNSRGRGLGRKVIRRTPVAIECSRLVGVVRGQPGVSIQGSWSEWITNISSHQSAAVLLPDRPQALSLKPTTRIQLFCYKLRDRAWNLLPTGKGCFKD